MQPARPGEFSHLIAMQAHETAPVALVGPAVGAWTRKLREPLLIVQLGAPRGARRRLEIMAARRGGGAAALWNCQHLELRDDALERERDPIAGAHGMRRLDALGVQMDFAAADRRGGERASFVKSREPEPLVQAAAVAFFRRVHLKSLSYLQPAGRYNSLLAVNF